MLPSQVGHNAADVLGGEALMFVVSIPQIQQGNQRCGLQFPFGCGMGLPLPRRVASSRV
jgi:hypothetical protein